MPRQLALIDRSADRKYFTIIPNILWTLNLTTVAFRLYTTIKKIAGEHGTCFMGTRRLAKEASISAGAVSAGKHELETAGLITIVRRKRSSSGHPIDHLQISDVWAQNMAHFANCSGHELNCSGDELKCSGDETEEEHEEEQRRNDDDDSNQEHLTALTDFGVDPTVARTIANKCTPAHVLAWIAHAKRATRLRDPVGLVVRRLLDNQPPPPPQPLDKQDPRRYITGKFAEYIQH